VPKAVASRLSLYLRELEQLQRSGQETTNSAQLGRQLGVTDAQVRKDLGFFGQFGRRGVGYRCAELIAVIKSILGTDRRWPVAIIGVGNLGQALLRYKGFQRQGFQVVAAFDVEHGKVGGQVEGIPLYHIDQLPAVVQEAEIRLALLAVPAAAAQEVADRLVAAGIEGIMNFAPVTISVPETVRKVGVDLAIELEQLSFAVAKRA
jgi:redox-sensing transcriptional repressor